jgi:hypothetical protein
MLTVNHSQESINLETRTAVSIDYQVSYVDLTTTTFTPGSTQGNINAIANTAIVPGPGSATCRQIKYLSLRNKSGTANTTVIFKKNTGTTDFHITSPISLRAGEGVIYSEQGGFEVLNSNGVPYLISVQDAPAPSLTFPEWCSAGALTTSKSLFSNTTWAMYVGKSPCALAGVNIRYNVTTAAATITWAEAALATGQLIANGNSALTVVGTTDISGVINSIGLKTTKIVATTPIHEYDDLWVLIGNQATTVAQIKQGTTIEHHQQGVMSANVNTRPSTILNIATGFLTESNAASNCCSLICIGYT